MAFAAKARARPGRVSGSGSDKAGLRGGLVQRRGRVHESLAASDAVAAYRESLRLWPENTDAWVNLGFAFLSLRRVPEGLQAYEKALSQRPYDPMALQGAAVARAVLGDSTTTQQYLARLRRVDPTRAVELEKDLGMRPR